MERFLKPSEVAKMLPVTKTTIYNWIKSGKLPACRIAGKSIGIKQSDVEALIIKIGTK